MVTDYTALKNAVIAKCAVTGDTEFASSFDTWVRLLEAALNIGMAQTGGMVLDPLRVKEMEKTVTLTVTSGEAAEPADFLEVRRITNPFNAVDALVYVEPSEYAEYGKFIGGRPTNFYTREGTSFKFLGMEGTDLTMLYYGNVPPLTLSGTNTTAIITRYPMIYYHGLLSYAWSWLQNEGQASREFGVLSSAVKAANAVARKPSGGVVYSKTGFYVP